MPNHVTQKLTVIEAEAPEVIRYIAGGDSAVDFHKVIPLPEELNIEETSEGLIGLAAITGKCERYLTFPWVENLGSTSCSKRRQQSLSKPINNQP